MKIERESVTPEKASAWLAAHNSANRPLNRVHVAALAASMSDGSWVENGDTISFSADGTLIDGQHRLSAVVKSGVAIPAIIVRGVPQSSFATKDIGRRRSAADALNIGGVKNASATAAAVSLLEWYASGQPTARSNRGIEPFHVVEKMSAYPGLDDSVRVGCTMSELCRTSVAAAAHYLFAKVDRAKADKFMDGVRTGAELSLRDPQLTLRARILKIKGTGLMPRATELLGLFIKAWNAYVAGQKIATIPFVFGVDAFPIVKSQKTA